MSQDAEHCLHLMLDKADAQPDRVRDVVIGRERFGSRPGDPYPFRNAQTNDEFHTYLLRVERSGLVDLEWDKHYAETSLRNIRLRDKTRLARMLGRSTLEEKIKHARVAIDWPDPSHWMHQVFQDVYDAWSQGKSKYGLKIDDPDKLGLVFKAMDGVDQMPSGLTLDYRQFGARYLGNSKAISSIAGPMTSIYCTYRNTSLSRNLSRTDVLAEMNLVKMDHPVLITGPVVLRNGQTSVSADVYPYLGVPSELLEDVDVTGKPYYLLTIENLSSFLEFTRTVERYGIVIYTAGYPTCRLQRFYALLATQLECPLYHWGDADADGFQILKTLQCTVPKLEIYQHQMDFPDGEVFDQKQINKLLQLGKINPEVDQIVNRCIETRRGRAEQESCFAMPPACYLT